MKVDKRLSRRILIRVLIFMLVSWAAVSGAAFWTIDFMKRQLQPVADDGQAAQALAAAAGLIQSAADIFWPIGVPAALLFFLILALILWRGLVRCCRATVPPAQPAKAPRAPAKPAIEPEPQDTAETANTQRRLFLHLLGSMQKEGRLMDFFSENLAQYDDAQIGAAMRDIHENCNRVLGKYIAPQAVLNQEEGEHITVSADFDPNAIKLIGNVTGRPPFKGIVRHRGWRARKSDLPILSGGIDPALIAPAEVEVN